MRSFDDVRLANARYDETMSRADGLLQREATP